MMKQILLIITLAMSCFTSAQSSNWTPLGTDDDGSKLYYNSGANGIGYLKEESDTKTVFAFIDGQNRQVPGYTVTTYSFDCAKNKIDQIQIAVYKLNGKLIENYESLRKDDLPHKDGDVDTVPGFFLKTVCSQ